MLRLIAATSLMLLSVVVSYAQSPDALLLKLPLDHQAWVNRSCPKSLSPSLWTSCITREANAVSPGIPDLSKLSSDERDWALRSCPTAGWLPPSLALSCLTREMRALSAGVPSLINLSPKQRESVQNSCPRSLPPSFYRTCVSRETAAATRVVHSPTTGSISPAASAVSSLPPSQTTKAILRADAREIEVSDDDEIFIDNDEKYAAKTNCFNMEEDDSVTYVKGSAFGACLSAVIVNQRTDQQCEVWCEPLDE